MIDGVNLNPNLSEQQDVDCVSRAAGYWSAGCNGGYSHEVFQYTAKLWASTEAAYPYKGITGTCQAITQPAGSVTVAPAPGYRTVSASKAAIAQAVSSVGPVITYFNVKVRGCAVWVWLGCGCGWGWGWL